VPSDMRYREARNMLGHFEGFVACRFMASGDLFVKFKTTEHAIFAKSRLSAWAPDDSRPLDTLDVTVPVHDLIVDDEYDYNRHSRKRSREHSHSGTETDLEPEDGHRKVCTIFVSDLPETVTMCDLDVIFSVYQNFKESRVVTKDNKTFAFVDVYGESCCEDICSAYANGLEIDGKRVRVYRANKQGH
jgi:hypothetical protein